MSHSKGFHARLKDRNRTYLDTIAERMGLKSAAAALNRLLDQLRQFDETPRVVRAYCPTCKKPVVTVNINRYAICNHGTCNTVFTLDARPVIYRIPRT